MLRWTLNLIWRRLNPDASPLPQVRLHPSLNPHPNLTSNPYYTLIQTLLINPDPDPDPDQCGYGREKELMDGVLRREQEQVELRGSAIVKTTWCVLLHRPLGSSRDVPCLKILLQLARPPALLSRLSNLGPVTNSTVLWKLVTMTAL